MMVQDKKKICLVGHECGYYKGQGGVATYIELTAKGLASLGHEVHVIFLHGTKIAHKNITSWKIEDKHDNYKNSQLIDKVLEKIKPDIVESTDFLGLINVTLSRRALGEITYQCNFITNHHTGIREVWEWGTELDFIECAPPWMRVLYQAERIQSLLSDANYSTSQFLANYLDKQHPESYNVCPSYYELVEQDKLPNKKNHYNKETLKVLSLGRFELRKKQELLIKAVCELLEQGLDIDTTLIGNSGGNFYTHQDYMEYCYSLIPVKFKSKFHFFDFMPYKELQNRYRDFDVFVVPSPYENFPNTALEAINYGITVLGSKSSGILDMVGSEGEVFCFEKNSVSDIKRVIQSYYVLDEENRTIVRDKQRKALKDLTSFNRAIQSRVEQYLTISPKRFNTRIEPASYVIVEQNKRQLCSKIIYNNKEYAVSDPQGKNALYNAQYLILKPENEEVDPEYNFFPEGGIISCFSHAVPYGTTKEILRSEKSFSRLTIKLEPNILDLSRNLTIAEVIAEHLQAASDVIFFKEEKENKECGIGIDIKYAIDKSKNKFAG